MSFNFGKTPKFNLQILIIGICCIIAMGLITLMGFLMGWC
jgi:hypothetical protein